jgi:hypothetical protein
LDIVDDAWAADTLSDDEIDVERHEAAIAPLLEEGELDVDAVVVSTGHSGSAGNGAAERRKREEGRWNDLALDQFDSHGHQNAVPNNNNANPSQGNGQGSTAGQQH